MAKRAKGSLTATYAYLGGNAMSRDKKGRPVKDDSATQHEMQVAGQSSTDGEYTPYVYYEFDII